MLFSVLVLIVINVEEHCKSLKNSMFSARVPRQDAAIEVNAFHCSAVLSAGSKQSDWSFTPPELQFDVSVERQFQLGSANVGKHI